MGEPAALDDRFARRLSTMLGVAVCVEVVLGVATLFGVPVGRPSGWLPTSARALYLIHAVVGLPLTLAAVTFALRLRQAVRMYVLVARIGLIGILLAGIGGVLSAPHPLRFVGLTLMLVGSLVAGFSYLTPAFEAPSRTPDSPFDSGEPPRWER